MEFAAVSSEDCSLTVTEPRCKHILKPLEQIDGERDGQDRGLYRLLKAISILLRLDSTSFEATTGRRARNRCFRKALSLFWEISEWRQGLLKAFKGLLKAF